MKNLMIFALLALLGSAAPLTVTAADAAATVTCKDGTTGPGGRGACHGHGGIAKKTADGTVSGTAPAAAADAAKPAAPSVTCTDGTTGRAGRGACSGHGGIAKAAKAAAPAAAPAPPVAPAAVTPASKPAASPATTAPGATSMSKATGMSGNTDPTGAAARCKDGSYSHSKHHSGACSHHGGVAEWLDKAQ